MPAWERIILMKWNIDYPLPRWTYRRLVPPLLIHEDLRRHMPLQGLLYCHGVTGRCVDAANVDTENLERRDARSLQRSPNHNRIGCASFMTNCWFIPDWLPADISQQLNQHKNTGQGGDSDDYCEASRIFEIVKLNLHKSTAAG